MNVHKWTVAEYERMIASGIPTEDVRVKLIAGDFITMRPIGDRHVGLHQFVIEVTTSSLTMAAR